MLVRQLQILGGVRALLFEALDLLQMHLVLLDVALHLELVEVLVELEHLLRGDVGKTVLHDFGELGWDHEVRIVRVALAKRPDRRAQLPGVKEVLTHQLLTRARPFVVGFEQMLVRLLLRLGEVVDLNLLQLVSGLFFAPRIEVLRLYDIRNSV